MRGDSFTSPIFVNLGSKLTPNLYQLTDEDALYFGLMEPNTAFEDAILKKKFTCDSPKDADGNILLMILPKETEKLLVGKYYYMIKLLTKDEFGQDFVKTIVQPTLFWLQGNNVKQKEEIHYDDSYTDSDRIIIDGGEIL